MIVRDKVFIHNGHALSTREAEVLLCAASGLTMSQAAKKLFISFNTVKRHHTNIHQKFELHGAPEFMILAIELAPVLKNWLYYDLNL